MRDSHFSQTFVRRPVLALVVSLVIALLGLASIRFLNIAQYPATASSVITINTPYPGANAELVRGFITVPLEQAIASADGIEFLTSISAQNISTINARLQLNYDVNDATAQILARINQVRNLLPEDSEDPVLAVNRGENTMLSAGYVNFFSAEGRSYRVIPQVQPNARITPEQLTRYHVRTGSGELVPLATIVRLRRTVEPRALARFEQLNAATLSGVLAPGVTLGEAVTTLRDVAERTLPADYSIDWQGESRQFVQEGGALMVAFAIAVALMY